MCCAMQLTTQDNGSRSHTDHGTGCLRILLGQARYVCLAEYYNIIYCMLLNTLQATLHLTFVLSSEIA